MLTFSCDEYLSTLGNQGLSMKEVNKGIPTKYESIEGLLWHKLQITLIKMKKGKHHNTAYLNYL